MTMQDYANINASNAIRSNADSAAQQAYYDALARGKDADTALAAAKFAWQQKLDEAGQTGMWNGQWNMPSNQWFTGQFGTWMPSGPTAGQETLAKQQQDYQQAFNLSQLYGQYYAPGSTPTGGQQTLGAQNQAYQQALNAAGLTGYFAPPGTTGQGTQTLQGQQQQFMQGLQTQQEARAAQAQQQSQAQAYLQLLSQLRGPADWAKYQQVLGSTPNGMRDLVAAAMGQYVPGGGATTGVNPQAVSLQSMMGQVAGQPYYGQGGGQLNMPNVYTGGQGSYGMQPEVGGPTGGQMGIGGFEQNQFQPQREQAWGTGIGIGQTQPTPQQQQQGLGNGTNLPAPNQVAAQSWHNLAPSQQQLMLGMWEGQGYDKNDVTALMNQALPKYATNNASAGTWRLGQ